MQTERLFARFWLSALSAALLLPAAAERALGQAAERNVTFLSTSDCHYDAFENEARNERNRDSIREMNAIATRVWPEQLGGGNVEQPRGVVVLGDCIDDGDRMLDGKPQSRPQYEFFRADFGLDGTDGLLKYPIFEGWGNHDGPPVGKERFGFSFQAELKKRNAVRQQKGWIGNLSENGFFVIQLHGDRLPAAYRVKANVKVTRNPDRTETRQWGGDWEWKWLLDKPLRGVAAAAESGGTAALKATVRVDLGDEKAPVSPKLYGIFMEEISHGFDGGIYAELIQNRSFEEGVLPPGMKLVKKSDGGLKMELEKLPPGVPKEGWKNWMYGVLATPLDTRESGTAQTP